MAARSDDPARGGHTVWVLGDQLNRQLGALRDAVPGETRILLVESTAKFSSKHWHLQRAHLVLAGIRRLAAELRDEGFAVDLRRAETLRSGFEAHCADHAPERVTAMEPASWDGLRLLRELGVNLVPSEQFLCHYEDFARWAEGRKRLTMEDFYRQRRQATGYLMDGDEPCGGRWNFDQENREPLPADGGVWPVPLITPLDDLDREVIAELEDRCWGAPPDGVWPTTRSEALRRLDHVIAEVLPVFGPHEDAMSSANWHLAHTLLSPAINLGLLTPDEVCASADDAYRSGTVPLASAEGFIRQILGWRDYVWGVYWLWMPDYRGANELEATMPLPPLYHGTATEMRCVASVLRDVHDHGWTHHIARLMVLGNLALLSGTDPWELTEWMWASFVDGAEWVMLPNVIGMALHADGGRMATKPYAAGGAYIDRMSDFCGGCRFDRTKRAGDDACPFTTLYWEFLHRHSERFLANHRMARQVRGLDRLKDLPETLDRAVEVRRRLGEGTL
ncbi:MAG: cryptochrome/photolyase family protein [Ilumatobacteraceae bacterium]